MIGRLGKLLGRPADAGEMPRADRVELATAALLVEMARADFEQHADEEARIRELLRQHFGIAADEADKLLREADAAADEAVSLHGFTRTLHESLEPAEKSDVVLMLWRIALADRQLDKYEDHLVGKIAELLYVPRAEVIRLRHAAAAEAPGGD